MLEVSNLKLEKSKTLILKNINLSLNENQFVGVFGPNGAGKSSFLRCLAGFERDAYSQILVRGRRLDQWTIAQRSRLVSWLPSHSSLPFDLTVESILRFGRYCWNQGATTTFERNLIDLTIKDLKMEHLVGRSFLGLSSGEQKLVLLARVLIQDTPLLLLDEPCAHLDLEVSLRILSHLKKLASQGKTIVASLHDIRLAHSLVDRSVIFSNGTCHDAGTQGLNPTLVKKYFNIESFCLETEQGRHLIFPHTVGQKV